MDDVVKQARKALEGVSPGPWAYCPNEWDDWGTVRAGLYPLCQVRDPRFRDEEYLIECRKEKRDPWKATGQFVADARQLVPAMADEIEALRFQCRDHETAVDALRTENARLREALEEIAGSRFCNYDNTPRDSYGIGVADGYRSCALMARAALGDKP